MSKDKWQSPDSFLLRNILEDDYVQTAKHEISSKRFVAVSAPPVLFDIGYKFQDAGLDQWDFDEPPENQEEAPKKSKKAEIQPDSQFEKLLFSPQNTPQKHRFSIDEKQFTEFTMVSESLFELSNPVQHSEQLMNNLGQVCQWAKDQNGSRTVQNILEGQNQEYKQIVFNMIYPQSIDLMKDRFGNYVFQKLFERGSIQHKGLLFQAMRGKAVQLSEHAYGCRVVQKAIEFIVTNKQTQDIFMGEINPHALRLIQNQNANHVIQKCFEVFPNKSMTQIVEKVNQKLQNLAFHAYGCRVIQKYLQNSIPQERPKMVMEKLIDLCIQLSKCQYGNYVMQHIVSTVNEDQTKVLEIFFKHFSELSSNKYASNVIQKAIKYSNQKYKDELGLSLANERGKDLIYLSKNQFGNYVIQSLYSKLSKTSKLAMKAKLKQNTSEISKSQYGRHVLMQLQKHHR